MRTASNLKTGLRTAPTAVDAEREPASDTTRTGVSASSLGTGRKSRLRQTNKTLHHRQRVQIVGQPQVSTRKPK